MLVNAKSTSRMESAMDWIRCSILPEDNIETPLRYHDATNTLASAALGVRTPYAINWQQQPINANGINEQLGPSDMGIFSFDYSPLHIISFYDPNASYRTVSYLWTWNGSVDGAGQYRLYFNELGQIRANKARHNNNPSTNWAAHGPWLYCKQDTSDNRYFWVDAKPGAVNGATPPAAANTTITIGLPGAIGDVNADPLGELLLYRYYNGNPQLCEAIAITSSTATAGVTFTLNNPNTNNPATRVWSTYSDFYTVIARRSATTDTAIAQWNTVIGSGVYITQNSYCSILRNMAMYESEILINFWGSKGRINAQGVRVTDVAMLQYVNGQIAGATAWDDYSWYEYWQFGLQGGRVFFDTVAQVPGAITLDLLDGGYIYHKPTQITDFNYHPFASWDAEWKVPDDMWVPLETGRPVKMIACTAANDNTSGNPTGGGASCFLTVATMIEWIPPVGCYARQKSLYSREACADGIDMAGNFPDFTDNDSHWEQFVDFAARAANLTAPVLRAAIEAGTTKLANINPKLAGIAKGLNTVGQRAVSAAQSYVKKRGRR